MRSGTLPLLKPNRCQIQCRKTLALHQFQLRQVYASLFRFSPRRLVSVKRLIRKTMRSHKLATDQQRGCHIYARVPNAANQHFQDKRNRNDDSSRWCVIRNLGNQTTRTGVFISGFDDSSSITAVPELSNNVVIFSAPNVASGKACAGFVGFSPVRSPGCTASAASST